MTQKLKIAIVCATFHKNELAQMLAAAKDEAQKIGIDIIDVRDVPGSMEIPFLTDHLMKKPDVQGVVALGIIERGQTAHGRVMGDAVISRLIDLQLKHGKPMGIGILGPEILPDQIAPRLDGYARAAVRAVKAVAEQI